MADGTTIEWTDATWNPIRASRTVEGVHKVGWHCEHASPGCINCYAERINRRLGTGREFKPVHLEHKTSDGRDSGDVKVFLDDAMLLQPLRWQRARLIFVCSMTDLFADFVTDEMLDKVFAIAMLARRHTFQVLTKRAARMRKYWSSPERLYRLWMAAGQITAEALRRDDIHGADISRQHWNMAAKAASALPLPNVWSGVSVEDQPRAYERVPELLATPAAVRWISAEPLIGPIDLTVDGLVCKACPWCDQSVDLATGAVEFCRRCERTGKSDEWGIDWVVAGGESGPGARPMHPDWARSLRDRCAAAGVPFLFKQWGEWKPISQMPDGDGPGSSDSNRGRPKTVLQLDGRQEFDFPAGAMTCFKVGKKAAGRLLDGVQHDGYPEARDA